VVFAFRISTGIPTPIYRQLVDQAKLAVASRQIEPGERMPSVRSVAEQLLVNPNTVARAYTDLVRGGVLEAQPGKGVFVAERRQRLSDDEREHRLSRAVEQFIGEVALLGFPRRELLARIDAELDKLGAGPKLDAPAKPAATHLERSTSGDGNE
jgi:GntR family transcriptional regulator